MKLYNEHFCDMCGIVLGKIYYSDGEKLYCPNCWQSYKQAFIGKIGKGWS